MTAPSCRYHVRTLTCGTEFDGVTVRRRTYLALQSGTGHFTAEQVALVQRTLQSAQVECRYLADDRCFALSMPSLFLAQKALEAVGWATRDQVPYFVWRWLCDFEEQPQLTEAQLEQQLGAELWQRLHPYQRVCVQKAAQSKRFYIADEMGTGKTFQALATCQYFRPQWPVLVLCPSSLRYTWRSEIVQWLGLSEADVLVAKNGKHYVKNHALDHSFLVLPYSLLTNAAVVATVTQHRYQVVVFDEAHYVKSMFSKRALQASRLAETADVKLLLSGTPFNYPSEMYQQIKILHPTLYPRFFNYRLDEDRHGEYYFAKRYCRPESRVVRGHSVWSFKGYDNHEELTALFYTFMIRRRKADILTQLPAKNRICITLEPLTTQQTREIQALLKADTTAGGEAKEAQYMASFRLTNQYKIPHVVKFLKEQILEDAMTHDPSMKTLIFFHHEAMQTALETLLRDDLRERFPYFVIAGHTSALKRDEFKAAFQTSERYRVGLLSITAAGVGLTLTAATTAVFTEILFGPNDHLQAEDRAHRLGQTSTVNIFYLLQPQTTDDINFGLIRKKEREASLMLDGRTGALPARRVEASALDATCGVRQLMHPRRPRTETAAETAEAAEPTPPPTVTFVTKRPKVQVYKLQDCS